MDPAIREFVRNRAGDRCEYCGMPQALTPFISFPVEHIVAKQHLEIIDPDSGEKVDLFDPRVDDWDEHFEHSDGWIIGKIPMGRATLRLLNMNEWRRVELRLQWLAERGES